MSFYLYEIHTKEIIPSIHLSLRPSLKDCLFRVTRPLKKDRGRSVGKLFFMAKILNRKNIYFPYISVGLYLVATYQCF